MEDHSILVDQARYDTSFMAKYIDTATVKKITKFYNTTFPSDTIFTKGSVSKSSEKVDNLTR